MATKDNQLSSVANGAAELKRLAATLETAGETDQALEVLEDVARLDPGDLQVRAALAQAFAARGDMERARQMIERASSLITQNFDNVMLPPKSHILGTPNRSG